MKKILEIGSKILPDKMLAVLYFIYQHKYVPNFSKPRSLNEKINFIKLYNRNPLREEIVDRRKVREYVKSKSPTCNLPSILWSGVSLDREIWEGLPQRFALKANHGSKMTKIIDKSVDDFASVANTVQLWMKKDYSSLGREWIYRNQAKYLLAEGMLGEGGTVPPDFKFFCTAGNVEFVQVDLSRFEHHTRNLYTPEFTRIDASIHFPQGEDITKPPAYEEALRIAKELSQDFDFIRVDLYLIGEKVYFGELTNTPGNGFEKISPKSFDFEVGKSLPGKILR